MYKSEVRGKGGISARVVADSISPHGDRITTFELEYPRFIHAEFMTHRMLSRNAASSRAIPVAKMLERIESSPAMPIHWGKNQPGMQAKEELSGIELEDVKRCWHHTANIACEQAEAASGAGAHKQVVNRLTEPFQFIKVVATATEWDNFFALRRHKDAQPEIQELANCMWEALKQSEPEVLEPGEWHVPYVPTLKFDNSKRLYCAWVKYMNDKDNTITFQEISKETALKISASCAAQVSYRTLDTSVEKALKIYDVLVNSKPVHASAFEHCASPMEEVDYWQAGMTHKDANGDMWSGNFKGWVQYRQLLPEHTVWDYQEE